MYRWFKEHIAYARYVYLWGWRWVVAIVWGLPYGLGGFYDFLQGQGYLPKGLPTVSQVIPSWANWVWLAIGVFVFAVITFEGSYRYAKNIGRELAKPVEIDRIAELRYKEKQKEREKEKQHRESIYGDISSLLEQSRETVIPLAMTVDISSVQQEKIDEVTQYIVKSCIEDKLYPLDFTQQELREEIRRAMEIRNIGIELLRNSKTEIGQILNALDVKSSNVRNVQLKDLITDFRNLTITQSCLELYARFLKSNENTLLALPVLKGREYWLDKIDTLQVKINALVDELLKLEDWK